MLKSCPGDLAGSFEQTIDYFMGNALKDDQTFDTRILVRVRSQQKFLNFFQGEWVLMNDLDHKLAQTFDISVLKEVFCIELEPF